MTPVGLTTLANADRDRHTQVQPRCSGLTRGQTLALIGMRHVQTMSSCYLFTWNLNANSRKATVDKLAETAFSLAVQHLAKQGTFIAAIQEPPEGISKDITMADSGGRVRIVERSLGAKVMILHSDDLHAIKTEPFDRMFGSTFGGDVWGDLQVLGVHIEDKRSYPEGPGRNDKIKKSGCEYLDFWRGGPLIVLGDFNANPWHPEVCAKEGAFYALRDRDVLEKEKKPTECGGGLRFPLYNPMWKHLQEKKYPEPRGTNDYTDDYGGIRPCLYDQVLLSKHLMNRVDEPPIILNEIAGQSLITDNKKRSAGGYPNFTDHLPVSMKINLQDW